MLTGTQPSSTAPKVQPSRVVFPNPNNLTNWGGTRQTKPDRIFTPTTRDEIKSILADTARDPKNRPVLTRGSLHSWSGMAFQNGGTLISLEKLPKNIEISADKKTVRVSGHVKMNELSRHLLEQGLMIYNIPIPWNVTVAGVAATNSHGTNQSGAYYVDNIVSMRLIDGLGRDIYVDQSGVWQLIEGGRQLLLGGDKYFKEARVHRGTLGVVEELTLRVEPHSNVKLSIDNRKASGAFANRFKILKDFFDTNEHPSAFWFVANNRIVFQGYKNTDATVDKPGWFDKFQRKHIVPKMSRFTFAAIKRFPILLGPIAFFSSRISMRDQTRVMNAFDGQTYTTAMAPAYLGINDMSYRLPYKHLEAALATIHEIVGKEPLIMPVFIRRVGQNLHIDFVWPVAHEKAGLLARRLEEAFIERFNAFPHEGKLFFRTPWDCYPPESKQIFKEIKNTLDPKGVFTNEFMKGFLDS